MRQSSPTALLRVPAGPPLYQSWLELGRIHLNNKRGVRVEQSSYVRTSKLERQELWDIEASANPSRRTLTGEVGFDTSIRANDAQPPHAVRLVHVARIEFAPEVPTPEIPIERPSAFDGRLMATWHGSAHHVRGELTVWLPQETFDELWNVSSQGEVEVSFRVRLVGSETGKSGLTVTAEGDYQAVPVTASVFRVGRPTAFQTKWLVARRELQIREALQELHFTRANNLQVAMICNELAQGIANLDDEDLRLQRLKEVIELIAEARGAFKVPLGGTGDQYNDNAYSLDKAAFAQFIEQFEAKRQEELKASYNQLWRHFVLVDTVRLGETAAGPVSAGFKCFQEDLDMVACRYAKLGSVRSKTLETLLIDALVLGEGLGFAQHVFSDQKLLGRAIPSAIEAPNAWAKLRSETGQSIWNFILEVVKIAVTYAIALTLTQEDRIATWVVVTGVTATRWLRKAFFWKELNPKLKLNEVLTKMAWVSETFKRSDFNALGARNHVHALALEGVTFSPWVLNILDRRINACN